MTAPQAASQRLPRKGDLLTLTAETLDDDGAAIARATFPIGKEQHTVKFTLYGALPGDLVEAVVLGRFRGVYDARVTRLLTPSPDRVTPRCHHAASEHGRPCGGCPLQALAYPAQVAHKLDRIRRHLEAHGLDVELLAPVPAVLTFGHRHKMEFSFANEGRLVLGLHPTGYRWEALDLTECPVLSPASSAFVAVAAELARELGLAAHDVRTNTGWLETLTIREAKRTSDRLFELTTNNADEVVTALGPMPAEDVARLFGERLLAAARLNAEGRPEAAEGGPDDDAGATGFVWTRRDAVRGSPTQLIPSLTLGRPALREILHLPGGHALEFLVHPRAFFQPHPLQAERLVAEVIQRLVPRGADRDLATDRTVRVADLYAGTGLLGLAVAPFVGSVVGVELVPEAVATARATAAANHLTHTEYLAGDVGLVLADPANAARFANLDAVILDPPRAGLAQGAFDAVARLRPGRVVYVSCHPASLARDIALFAHVGYRPAGPLQPVDMFPHTPHIECVVALERIASA